MGSHNLEDNVRDASETGVASPDAATLVALAVDTPAATVGDNSDTLPAAAPLVEAYVDTPVAIDGDEGDVSSAEATPVHHAAFNGLTYVPYEDLQCVSSFSCAISALMLIIVTVVPSDEQLVSPRKTNHRRSVTPWARYPPTLRGERHPPPSVSCATSLARH